MLSVWPATQAEELNTWFVDESLRMNRLDVEYEDLQLLNEQWTLSAPPVTIISSLPQRSGPGTHGAPVSSGRNRVLAERVVRIQNVETPAAG